MDKQDERIKGIKEKTGLNIDNSFICYGRNFIELPDTIGFNNLDEDSNCNVEIISYNYDYDGGYDESDRLTLTKDLCDKFIAMFSILKDYV